MSDIPAKAIDIGTILTAVAAVSGVLWTGSLVVLQMYQSAHPEYNGIYISTPPAPEEPHTQEQVKYTRTINSIRASMAVTAFGTIAPLFAMVLSTDHLRQAAWIFAPVYGWLTRHNLPSLIDAFVKDGFTNWSRKQPPIGFMLPTLAMVLAIRWSSPDFIALESVLLSLYGYQTLSSRIGQY